MNYLLGLDVGSSSVKAALLDAASGACAGSAFYPKTEQIIDAPQPGFAPIRHGHEPEEHMHLPGVHDHNPCSHVTYRHAHFPHVGAAVWAAIRGDL